MYIMAILAGHLGNFLCCLSHDIEAS